MRKLALLVAVGIVGVPFTAAVAAKAPVKKPAAKPAPKPAPKPAVISSTQLKGDQAKFEQEYSLGKDWPVNIIVHSAHYSVARVTAEDDILYPDAGEKLLVVKMTIRNPMAHEYFIRYDTLGITAITADSSNFECTGWVVNDGKLFSMNVKPAQKVDVVAYIKVPAKEDIPKLMFKSSDDRVLRYDLRGKVKGLESSVADPADPKGATALAVVPGQIGVACDLGAYDFKLDSFSYTTEPPKETELEDENNHYLVLYGSIKNGYPTEMFTRYDTFAPTVTTTDGDDIEYRGWMELGSRHEWFSQTMKPAQEVKVRIYFEMSKDVTPQTFTMKTEDGKRAFTWDLSSLQK